MSPGPCIMYGIVIRVYCICCRDPHRHAPSPNGARRMAESLKRLQADAATETPRRSISGLTHVSEVHVGPSARDAMRDATRKRESADQHTHVWGIDSLPQSPGSQVSVPTCRRQTASLNSVQTLLEGNIH